jgi:DNA-binding NarL/FixJ family response regulator
LVTAIRRAAEGERYINRQIAGRLVVEHMHKSAWD